MDRSYSYIVLNCAFPAVKSENNNPRKLHSDGIHTLNLLMSYWVMESQIAGPGSSQLRGMVSVGFDKHIYFPSSEKCQWRSVRAGAIWEVGRRSWAANYRNILAALLPGLDRFETHFSDHQRAKTITKESLEKD